MESIKDVMNAAVTDKGAVSKRIAGDAGREYIFHRDPTVPKDQKKEELRPSGSLGKAASSGGWSSGGLGATAVGKPPLPPKRSASQVRQEALSLHPKTRFLLLRFVNQPYRIWPDNSGCALSCQFTLSTVALKSAACDCPRLMLRCEAVE